MGDILEPSIIPPLPESPNKGVLLHENYLSEFINENEKVVIRENIGVYAKTVTYTKDETLSLIQDNLRTVLKEYSTTNDVKDLIGNLTEEIKEEGYVLSDGSVPFTSPQSQSSLPISEYHLTNKIYVDNLLKAHINSSDPHKTLDRVKQLLAGYVRTTDTYTTQNLYNKKEIDLLLRNYIKKDGSIPFVNPQIGVDPELPSHLTTMRYVQRVMYNHKNESDPHNFLSTLKRSLSNYYTKSEIYTKAQTYSRTQLLSIIKSQMKDIVDQAIASHEASNGSVSDLRDFIVNQLADCIKSDGSVVHMLPQAGMPAVHENEFVVLSQLTKAIDELSATLNKDIKSVTNQAVWVPSGPVKTTVGFVEDNTNMPRKMTVQQVCDAIFYGRKVGIEAPSYAEYGDMVCIEIYTHGLSILTEVEVFKNDTLIGTLSPSDFSTLPSGVGDSGLYYKFCDTGEFTEDTEWKVVFHYSDGQAITDTTNTKLSYPIFIGAIPYWWNAQEDITMKSLREKTIEDPDNCKFYTKFGPEVTTVDSTFNFTDVKQRSIVVVTPKNYPDLDKLITPTQEIHADAFAKWVQPMYPNAAQVGVLYKIYVFNQPLVKLNQDLKFYFKAASNP